MNTALKNWSLPITLSVFVCVETIKCTQYGQSFWVWKVKSKLTCTLSECQQGATAPTVPTVCKLMRKRPFFLLDWLPYKLQIPNEFTVSTATFKSSPTQHDVHSNLYIMVPFRVKNRVQSMVWLLCDWQVATTVCPCSRTSSPTVSSKYVHAWLQKKQDGDEHIAKLEASVVQISGLHHGGFTLVSVHFRQ